MSNELVTIYVPSRNYGKYLGECLKSIEQQSYPHWEVILFNEASDDDTADICEAFVAKHPEKARYFHNKPSIGLQKIGNIALKLARGQFLMRVDADDFLDESALLILTSKMRSDEKVALVFGNFYLIDEMGRMLGVETRKQGPVSHSLGRDAPAHGACTLVRTKILKTMGGYNEDVTAQDGWDLWFKMLGSGEVAHVETALFYYRQHTASLSKDKSRLIKARNGILEALNASRKSDYNIGAIGVMPVKQNAFQGISIAKLRAHLDDQIEVAQTSGVFDKILLSIESKDTLSQITDIIQDKDVWVYLRDSTITGEHQIPIREILLEAGKVYEEQSGFPPDIVFFLNTNSVGREAEDIKGCMNLLTMTGAETVMSVEEERSPMLGVGESGLEVINPGRFADITLHHEQMLRFNGSMIGCWWPTIQNNSIFSSQICASEQARGKITTLK